MQDAQPPPPVPVILTLSASALEELKAGQPPTPPPPRVDLTVPTVFYVASVAGAWAGASATCVADDVCDTVTPVLPTVGSPMKALGWGLLIQGGTRGRCTSGSRRPGRAWRRAFCTP